METAAALIEKMGGSRLLNRRRLTEAARVMWPVEDGIHFSVSCDAKSGMLPAFALRRVDRLLLRPSQRRYMERLTALLSRRTGSNGRGAPHRAAHLGSVASERYTQRARGIPAGIPRQMPRGLGS